MTQAIILAGGFGTRLSAVVKDLPKPMAPVNNKPFLHYQLHYLAAQGIKQVVFSTGNLADTIHKSFGNNYAGIAISYSHEEKAMGTGGGIRLALEKSAESEVLVLNGDSFFDIQISELKELYAHSMPHAVLALREVNNAARYGTVELDQGLIVSFYEKSGKEQPGIISAGVYVLNRATYLAHTPEATPFSIEKDFFEVKLNTLRIAGKICNGYFIDIGIPDDYYKAQDDFKGFKY